MKNSATAEKRARDHGNPGGWGWMGRGWPNLPTSRRMDVDSIAWHVQVAGPGRDGAPVLLLLHGAGGATHSWRRLLPLLAQHFTVIAPDLPGHGLTDAPVPPDTSLDGLARSVRALLQELDMMPAMVVGHAAGAAILARMCLDGAIAPRAMVALGSGMQPADGVTRRFAGPVMRTFRGSPLFARFISWRARRGRMADRMLATTGSSIDPEGVELYKRLVRSPDHLAAALGIGAHWDTEPLLAELPRLDVKLLMLVGENDRSVPARRAEAIGGMVPGTALRTLPGLGNLAHEEQPATVATLVEEFAREVGVLV